MDNIGIALMVGGSALLCSGLIFLLPVGRGSSRSQASLEDSLNEIEAHLEAMRQERRYPGGP